MTELTLFRDELAIGELIQYLTSADRFNGGGGVTFTFPNGYEASIIRHNGSYGGKSGLFEAAIYRGPESVHIVELTGENDNVIGWLTAHEVVEFLGKVHDLKG